jgi:gluconate kinase
MAKRNYLVEGLSGAGKSSVYEELIRRGYKAISTDRAWKYYADPDTGLRGGPRQSDNSMWDEQRAVGELESPEPQVLFVCGSSRNRDRFLPYFTKIFNLRIDDDTMRRRLQERTNNDFGKQREELELMLRLNRSDEKPAGAIDVDATQPLHRVVDDLLRLASCSVTSDSRLTPWSKRRSAVGQSFVIAESALPSVQDAAARRKSIFRGASDHFWDVLGRETITRIEYSWSGYVLATLLPYLDEQGIDLMHSAHDEVTSTLSQTRAGSVFVLTSDHRERYLARLDPIEFDGAVLRRYYEEFNDMTAEGVDYAMLDGIAFFRDTLEPLQSAIVAVFMIGKSLLRPPAFRNGA